MADLFEVVEHQDRRTAGAHRVGQLCGVSARVSLAQRHVEDPGHGLDQLAHGACRAQVHEPGGSAVLAVPLTGALSGEAGLSDASGALEGDLTGGLQGCCQDLQLGRSPHECVWRRGQVGVA